MQRYKKCKNKYLHFLFLGKPFKLFDTTNPDWVPTLKLVHDKLTVNTSKATARYSRSKERSTKKFKLGALSTENI